MPSEALAAVDTRHDVLSVPAYMVDGPSDAWPAGVRTIPVVSRLDCAIKPGDTVEFAGDPTRYRVDEVFDGHACRPEGTTSATAIRLPEPGLVLPLADFSLVKVFPAEH